MTFLKFSMILGLALVSVPIIIHLLNRHKARPVEWAAMRFLMASLAAQSKRLLLEEMILLGLRCLAVAAMALAMARPFLPSRPTVPWPLVLPLVLAAAICVGIAAALWTNHALRRKLCYAAGICVAVAVLTAVLEKWLQRRSWLSGDGDRDIVLVVDGSESMKLSPEGKTNFKRAVDEAVSVVRNCNSGDAVGLILAGPVPRALVRAPTSNHAEITDILKHEDFQPTGGALGVLEAFNAASAMLAEGHNPVKKIILFTDGQNIGWDPHNLARWSYLAQNMKDFPVPPKIICRRFPLPREFKNAAVSAVTFSRQVTGTDRPVRIDVKVTNTGTFPQQPAAIALFVDGANVMREPFLKELLPGAAETVRFDHRFETPGRHVVKCQLMCDDDLPGDNAAERVVDVLDRLPVLIVDGSPSKRPMESAADFIRIALTPGDRQSAPAAPAPAAAPPAGPGAPPPAPAPLPLRLLVEPTVIAAEAAGDVTDLAKYRTVILANLPRLPAALTEHLTNYVKSGGGLLIAPGNRAEPKYYNACRTPSGDVFLPALLGERRVLATTPAHFELKTFTHPALKLMADTTQSDAASVLIQALWKLRVDAGDASVRVGGLFDTGEPFLVERQLGRGFMIMVALAQDRRDSNLPSFKAFVPLLHELVYYLAAPMTADGNIRPGTEMSFEVAAGTVPTAVSLDTAIGAEAAGRASELEVQAEGRKAMKASLITAGSRSVVRFSETRHPGLYRVILPPGLATLPDGKTPLKEIPFIVLSQPEESQLVPLTDNDVAALREHLDLFVTGQADELMTAAVGGVPGQELWKFMALVALLALVAEVALARWIAIHRRFHAAEIVTLRSPMENLQAFHRRAAEMLGESTPHTHEL